MPTRARARAAVVDAAELFRAPIDPAFQQERSRKSYGALLEAATTLFSDQGYDAVGTPEIAERAGVSVGTFYRYFDDKHEIYLEVVRRMLVSAYQQTIEGLGPERFVGRARHETIGETVAVLFGHVLATPRLSRSFIEMSLRDPAAAALRRAFEAGAHARLVALITAVAPRTTVPDPEATAFVLYGAAMHTAYGLAGHVGDAPVSAARARDALVAFVERALFPST